MTCYICWDEGEDMLHGVCDCKNSAVHTACLVKWIEQSKKAHCSVCAKHFQGVDVTTHVAHPHEGVHKYVYVAVLLGLYAAPTYFLVRELARSVVMGRTGSAIVLGFVCLYITLLFWLLVRWYSRRRPQRSISTARLQDLALTV